MATACCILRPRNFQESLHQSKVLSFVLSIITMLSSIALIGFAIGALVEFSFASPIIGSNVLNYGAGIVLFIGVLTFAATPMGIFSMVTHEASLLHVHWMAMFALGAISITSLGLGALLKYDIISGDVNNWGNESLQNEYGNPEGTEITVAWNKLQQKMTCCGWTKDGPLDYRTSAWLKAQLEFPRKFTPESCCATCASIHQKFCYQFLTQDHFPPVNSTAVEKICFDAAARCSEASDVFRDFETCTGRRPLLDHSIPKESGCYSLVETRLMFYSHRLMFVSLYAFGLLLLGAFSSFKLSQKISVSPYVSIYRPR